VYAGTVDARLDVEAFRALAADGFDVRVAGPLVDAGVRAALADVPGVELLGSRPRAEVVALTQDADVCVLAHHRTPLTEAMSPLKLYEYLASGTPVVATRLPGAVVAADDRVVWVEPGADHAAGARAAVALGRQPEPERLAAVQAMSWRARHRPLLDLLGATTAVPA
jgi:glycosyltransferase involved in cell wall biosynthesis